MRAGNHGEAMLQVLDRLCAELGAWEPLEAPGEISALAREGTMASILSPEDEAMVAALRRGLARVAAALGGEEDRRGRAVAAALDGAEVVIRGELVSDNRARLPVLMPSFVFLVALPIVNQDRALEISRRAEELLAAEPLA